MYIGCLYGLVCMCAIEPCQIWHCQIWSYSRFSATESDTEASLHAFLLEYQATQASNTHFERALDVCMARYASGMKVCKSDSAALNLTFSFTKAFLHAFQALVLPNLLRHQIQWCQISKLYISPRPNCTHTRLHYQFPMCIGSWY